MATRNLTKASIESLAYNPNGPSRQVLWDAKVRGFGARVTPQGGKQYVLSYRFNGRARLMSLGPLEHFLTLDQARDKAGALLHDLRHNNIDPLSTRERLSAAETIEALWAVYEREHLVKLSYNTKANLLGVRRARDPDYVGEAGGWWGAHIQPALGRLKPTQVASSDLIRLHDRITASAGAITANRCITRLAHFFDWLAERDEHLFPAEWKNPARRVTVHKESPRSHFLTVDQMQTLFGALDTHADPYFKGFVGMLLFTAARKNEVLGLRWSDIDMQTCVARVKRTKNGTPLAMPLPELAVRLLESLPRMANNEHVFPAKLKRSAPMTEPRHAYKALLKQLKLPVETTFHDLRRSVGCSLAAAGYSETMISALLNNTATMAAKHYIRLAGETKRKIADAHAALFMPAKPNASDSQNVVATLPAPRS